ncbi:uncharacterized protein LOC130683007 [Manis pentadactyla]|uniref:uncharacterized protein LOC130683007 n=1 Tax=Manis pentadactyla TaxID=143292 RepID=UPI00255CFDE4|nr:uncharacterized protein LOC130683007 [Manis pentadactyla]
MGGLAPASLGGELGNKGLLRPCRPACCSPAVGLAAPPFSHLAAQAPRGTLWCRAQEPTASRPSGLWRDPGPGCLPFCQDGVMSCSGGSLEAGPGRSGGISPLLCLQLQLPLLLHLSLSLSCWGPWFLVLERPLSVPPAWGRSSLLPALSILYTPTAAWRLPLATGARRMGGQCPGSPSPMTDGSSSPAEGCPAVCLQPPQGPVGGPDSPWGFGSCPRPRPPHRCPGIPPQQLSLRDPPKHASPPPAGLSVVPHSPHLPEASCVGHRVGLPFGPAISALRSWDCGQWGGDRGALGGVSRLALTAPAVPVLGTLGSAPGPGGRLPLCQLPWDREAGYTKCSLHNWHEDTRKAPGKSKQP